MVKLQKYYEESIPEYFDLSQRYKEEQKKAKNRHELRKFPSIDKWTPSGWMLTPTEKLMCLGPENSVKITKRFVHKNYSHRSITISSEQSLKSNCLSSSVSVRSSSSEILLLYLHILSEFLYLSSLLLFVFLCLLFTVRSSSSEILLLYLHILSEFLYLSSLLLFVFLCLLFTGEP